jgi:hypothetical protein
MNQRRSRPSEMLLLGRRGLEGIRGVQILDDWWWFEEIKSWALHICISVQNSSHATIPAATDWYLVCDDRYPGGGIHIFPAIAGGLDRTYYHQRNNSRILAGLPWRSGDICADHALRAMDRSPWFTDSMDPITKLADHVRRALEWLEAASNDDLVRDGEPFELPDFSVNHDITFAFIEDEKSFASWQDFPDAFGLAAIGKLSESVYYAVRFDSIQNRKNIMPEWGMVMQDPGRAEQKGIWLRLKEAPVLPPWQAPLTLGELRQVCLSQGVDLNGFFDQVSSRLRDRSRHLFMIGFPIPAHYGEPPSRMHWQALILPTLSFGKKTQNGFRPNESGHRMRDKNLILTDNLILEWIPSENWDIEQISTRGHLSSPLLEKHILLVGAGALGCVVAEILTRGGIRNLVLVDSDLLRAGNLVRHTLTLSDMNMNKANALASRLNHALPQSRVRAIPARFPPEGDHWQAIIQKSEIVIDCTGSDEALWELDKFSWTGKKEFFSLSLGYGARRLFCYRSRQTSFSVDSFNRLVRPWLSHEREENKGASMPMEGIGCWHPVFPARVDDIFLLASAGVKWIETSLMELATNKPEFVVFEQIIESGIFGGLRKY